MSSLSIAVMLRVFEGKDANRVVIIASNYIVAGTLSLVLSRHSTTEMAVIGYGIGIGLFFFIAFVVFSFAIKKKGMATTVTIGRLSLALPVLFSIFLWGETPTIPDVIALLLILVIILTWEGKIGKVSPILIVLFFLFGSIDTGMKYFKLHFSHVDDGFFLVILYYSSMVWSWAYLLVKKIKPGRKDILKGFLLGIPNFFSAYFLLKALHTVPAYVTFPFINVGMIILSSVAGVMVFKEKLDRRKIILVILGIGAVILLTT